MSPIGERQGWEIRAAQGTAMRRRALEKPSAASGLRNGSGGEPSFGSPRSSGPIFENPHHSGTHCAVPFRDIAEVEQPRLTAAFVAQLLGQVLPDPEQGKSQARTAYRSEEDCTALLLDTLL
jgi:hypothetical protein